MASRCPGSGAKCQGVVLGTRTCVGVPRQEKRHHPVLGFVCKAELAISHNLTFAKKLTPSELDAQWEEMEAQQVLQVSIATATAIAAIPEVLNTFHVD